MDEKVNIIRLGLRVMNIDISKPTIEKIIRLINLEQEVKEITLMDCIEVNELVNKKNK